MKKNDKIVLKSENEDIKKTIQLAKMVDMSSIYLEGTKVSLMSTQNLINSLVVMNWRHEFFKKTEPLFNSENDDFLKYDEFLFDGKTPEQWILILMTEIQNRKNEKLKEELGKINKKLKPELTTDELLKRKAEIEAKLNS